MGVGGPVFVGRRHGNGQLNVRVVNNVWNVVCRHAGIKGHTPHDARHAIGEHIIKKIDNIAAGQRQPGHPNPAYPMQYARSPTRIWLMR